MARATQNRPCRLLGTVALCVAMLIAMLSFSALTAPEAAAQQGIDCNNPQSAEELEICSEQDGCSIIVLSLTADDSSGVESAAIEPEPCINLGDPYVCGFGFEGVIDGGTAPYRIDYTLTPSDGSAPVQLPPLENILLAGPYEFPVDHDVYSGPYSVTVTLTDANGNTDSEFFDATLTTNCCADDAYTITLTGDNPCCNNGAIGTTNGPGDYTFTTIGNPCCPADDTYTVTFSDTLNSTGDYTFGTANQCGTVTIEKVANGGGGGERFVIVFSGDAGVIGTPSLGNGESFEYSNLGDGIYTLTEEDFPGWINTDITCTSSGSSSTWDPDTNQINLQGGETVDCVVTNERIASCEDASLSPCVILTDPYVCGTGFEGTITDGQAPYSLQYTLTPAGSSTAVQLPLITVNAAGPYAVAIDHDVYTGPYSVTVTVTDANSNTDSESFDATLTTDCTEPAPEPPVQPDPTAAPVARPAAPKDYSLVPDLQAEKLLAAIVALNAESDEVLGNVVAAPPAAASPAAAAPTAEATTLAHTGATTEALAMLGLAILGSGAYLHGARGLRKQGD